jgi:RHS repeat-associated protein
VVDHLGSVRGIVDAAGNVTESVTYGPFGEATGNVGTFGYAGGLTDTTTGLVHFGAREYAPWIGRWTTKDPIGFGGGDTLLYGYVGGDPIQFVDPSGLAIIVDNGLGPDWLKDPVGYLA